MKKSGKKNYKKIIGTGTKSDPIRYASGNDPVNPSHYKGDYVMRVIEDFNLGFCTGNVVKYICRHGEKAGLEDLKKARWYLDREISNLEKDQK